MDLEFLSLLHQHNPRYSDVVRPETSHNSEISYIILRVAKNRGQMLDQFSVILYKLVGPRMPPRGTIHTVSFHPVPPVPLCAPRQLLWPLCTACPITL